MVSYVFDYGFACVSRITCVRTRDYVYVLLIGSVCAFIVILGFEMVQSVRHSRSLYITKAAQKRALAEPVIGGFILPPSGAAPTWFSNPISGKASTAGVESGGRLRNRP